MVGSPSWLVLFADDCLQRWEDLRKPTPDLQAVVTSWLMTRMEDPYAGARRVPDFPNMWFAKVAGSDHGPYAAVFCTYDIEPRSGW